jgi:hypothetical protein
VRERRALTADDTRELVPLAHPRDLIAPPDNRLHARTRALAGRVSAFLDARGSRFSWRSLPLQLAAVLPVFTLVAISLIFFGVLGCVGLPTLLIAVPVALRYLLRESAASVHARSLTATIVAEGLCASCGYPVVKLRADNEGLISCPECGARWRRARVVAPVTRESPRVPGTIERWWHPLLGVLPLGMRMAPDASGRLLPIVDPYLRTVPAEAARRLGLDRYELSRATRRPGTATRLAMAFGVLALNLACLLVLRLFLVRTEWPVLLEMMLLVLLGVVGLVAAGWIAVIGVPATPVSIAREVVLRGRCPCCLEVVEQREGRET